MAGTSALLRLARRLAADGWHMLGVGAPGILASAMTIRTTLQREAEPDRFPPAASVAVSLVAAAAVTPA